MSDTLALTCQTLCSPSPNGFVATYRTLKQVSYFKWQKKFQVLTIPQRFNHETSRPLLCDKSNSLMFIGPTFDVWELHQDTTEYSKWHTTAKSRRTSTRFPYFLPDPSKALETLFLNSKNCPTGKTKKSFSQKTDYEELNINQVRLFLSKKSRTKHMEFHQENVDLSLLNYASFFCDTIGMNGNLLRILGWPKDLGDQTDKTVIQTSVLFDKFTGPALNNAIRTLF